MFRVTDADGVRTLTIDNPARRNAIGPTEFGELGVLFEEFEASDARVLVVTGAGDDFCSGLDLAAGGAFEGGTAGFKAAMEQTTGAAVSLFRCTKPTIAAVDGVAAGAGINLALGCDIVIASDRARFTEIFVRRGLTLDFGGTWLLPRLVGLARAKELALTGRVVDAAEALEYGMVTEIVAVDALTDRAAAVASQLAVGAPLAQRIIKRGLDRSFEMSFEEAAAYETQAQAMLLGSEDAMEGFVSFLEKRDPDFRGK
jgi:2-(1,2-epoxy-1,2-dihydrophenyl)acetyl-CoA isomerase